jgi:hypothetical protein
MQTLLLLLKDATLKDAISKAKGSHLELQGPQKTIVFHSFSISYLFHVNFVPIFL